MFTEITDRIVFYRPKCIYEDISQTIPVVKSDRRPFDTYTLERLEDFPRVLGDPKDLI